MSVLDFMILAQARPQPSGPPPGAGAAIGAMLAIYAVIVLVVTIPTIAGMWAAFSKAGQPGWAAIVPFYNVFVVGEISGKGGVYGLLVYLATGIPCVGLVALIFIIMMLVDLAKRYDCSAGFGVGLALLPMIFWPILGFGSAQYVGDSGGGGGRGRRRRSRDDYDDDDDDRPRRRRDDDDDDDRGRRDDRIRRPRRDDY